MSASSAQKPTTTRSASAPGFTLIELLAVITTIGVLAAIVVATVGKVRRTAYRTKEVAAARFLVQAYLMASDQDNRGVLIPYRNDKAVTGSDVSGNYESGEEASSYDANIWATRIRPFLGNRFVKALYVNQQEDYYNESLSKMSTYTTNAAYYPTFGINYRWLGSGSDQDNKDPKPISHIQQAILPSGLIAFVGSMQYDTDPKAGFWRVDAPSSWSKGTAPASEKDAKTIGYGFVAFRYDLKAVVAFLDGHVSTLRYSDLKDMRLWSNTAREQDAPNYSPGFVE